MLLKRAALFAFEAPIVDQQWRESRMPPYVITAILLRYSRYFCIDGEVHTMSVMHPEAAPRNK
jgi:hypothetical protein